MGHMLKDSNIWNHSTYNQIWVISNDKQVWSLRAHPQPGHTVEQQQHLPS